MALQEPALPYGLREIKIAEMNADGTYQAAVKLPAAQTLSFGESEDFNTLRGDDKKQAVVGGGASVSWDLEAGGIDLDAYAVIAGGTVTVTGVTPNIVKTYKKQGADTRPYFKVEGRSISDAGGDVHGIIWKARATGDIEGEFADESFWVTSASGEGIPDANDDLYDFVQNETATPIA